MEGNLLIYMILLSLAFNLNVRLSWGQDKPNQVYEELHSRSNWGGANKILTRIKAPAFPDKVFNITDYGAVGDGVTLNTEAINSAIKECSSHEGGLVLVPPGVFKTGAIHLEDNVNLKLLKGAELQFSVEPKDYLPVVETSWEGIVCYNYSPLIYAGNKKNVAITGEGVLNGMASSANWWKWKGVSYYGWEEGEPSQNNKDARPLLVYYNKTRAPINERIFGEGGFLRPQFIQFYKCTNVFIEGVTIKSSPFWVVHPVFCENVTVKGITVNSMGPNNDGCDPESCKNVLIEECVFNTGDDCIALKSGRNEDGREINKPIENVIIRNCHMKNGHGGVVIGSEISGGARNIFAENCRMDSPMLERAIRIKTNSNRGGIVDSIFVRDIEIGEVEGAVVQVNCKYNSKEGEGNYIPLVQNVFITNVKSEKSRYAFFMTGLEGKETIRNIFISESGFSGVEKPSKIEDVYNVLFENVTVNGINYRN